MFTFKLRESVAPSNNAGSYYRVQYLKYDETSQNPELQDNLKSNEFRLLIRP